MNKSNNSKACKHIICVLRVLALVVPLFIYILAIILIPTPNSGFIIPGIAGSLIISIGLEFIIGVAEKSFIGIWPTIIVLSVGALLLTMSVVCLYSPFVQSIISEKMITYYFLVWCFILYLGIIYIFFRMSIKKMLRCKKISNTAIKKSLKGYKNYWWYEELHEKYNLGFVYRANKVYVVFLAVSFTLHCILGWCFALSPIITVCVCGTCVSSSVLGGYIAMRDSDMQWQYIILGVCSPLAICYAVSMYTLQMWG